MGVRRLLSQIGLLCCFHELAAFTLLHPGPDRRSPCDLLTVHTSSNLPQYDEVTDDSLYYSPNVPLLESDDEEDTERNALLSDDDDELLLSEVSIDTDRMTLPEYSFFDQAFIQVRAGSGGQGSNAYKQQASSMNKQRGPADGGNGGQGGHVLLQVDPSLNTLAGLSPNAWRPNSFGGSGAAASIRRKRSTGSTHHSTIKSFAAEHGQDGKHRCQSGANGASVIIRVPPGTVVHDVLESGQQIQLTTLTVEENPSFTVARGGVGGEGTGVLLKSGRGVKRPRQSATGGERKRLLLTLKIVADVALVAVPNAGKSTLLAAVTRAKPKIANYPFTTVIPNLGVWVPPDDLVGSASDSSSGSGSDGLVLCDVPGLIAGASKGVGLGHAFLRHVERCHVILHIIDATSNDPVADYVMLNRELVNYGTGQLAKMPQVVVVNKVDVLENGDNSGEEWEKGLKARWTREELQSKLQEVIPHTRLLWISAKDSLNVDELMARLAAFVKKVKSAAEDDDKEDKDDELEGTTESSDKP